MTTSTRLGIALLTALSTSSITGDELGFRATPEAELRGTLERTYDWTLLSIAFEHGLDHSSYSPSLTLPGQQSLTLHGEHQARWCDTWEGVEDEQPVTYRRTIEALGSQLEWKWSFGSYGHEAVGAEMVGVLVDADLRARRGEDGWSFEVLWPSWMEDVECDGLAGAVGWSGVLPDAPVAEGTNWYPAGTGVHELVRPLGRPRMELESVEASHPELFALLCRLLDPGELLEFGDDSVSVRYLATDEGVAELELTLRSGERIDIAERAREEATALGIDEETRKWLERATVDVHLEGDGTLLWSTAESRPVSAELQGTIDAELRLVIGVPWDVTIRADFSGEFRENLSFAHSPPERDDERSTAVEDTAETRIGSRR